MQFYPGRWRNNNNKTVPTAALLWCTLIPAAGVLDNRRLQEGNEDTVTFAFLAANDSGIAVAPVEGPSVLGAAVLATKLIRVIADELCSQDKGGSLPPARLERGRVPRSCPRLLGV